MDNENIKPESSDSSSSPKLGESTTYATPGGVKCLGGSKPPQRQLGKQTTETQPVGSQTPIQPPKPLNKYANQKTTDTTAGVDSTIDFSILNGPSFAVGASPTKNATGVSTSPKSTSVSADDVDSQIVVQIQQGYEVLRSSTGCKSLLKKYLTKVVMEMLKKKKTSFGSTLLDVIQSGMRYMDSNVGIYAPDPDAYKIFAELFDPVIAEIHGLTLEQRQPPVDLGEQKMSKFSDLDPDKHYIVLTRIRCRRSLLGYPFSPCLTEENYEEIERKMIKLFDGFKGPDLIGKYYPLTGMNKKTENHLMKDHFLFSNGDKWLGGANGYRFWPKGRGIFVNNKKTFAIWLNEEDHLQFISSCRHGGHVGRVVENLIRALKIIEAQVAFCRSDRYGWLTVSPTNLGTTIAASVHIKLSKICRLPDFDKLCDSMQLHALGILRPNSQSKTVTYIVSNKRRMGISEYDVVSHFYDGIKKLIEMEKAAA